MSSYQNGLCEKLAQSNSLVGSILIWGENLTDCDLTARYYHQEVLHNSNNSLSEIVCQQSDDLGMAFHKLFTLPKVNYESDKRLTHSVILHGIENLTGAQQLRLLHLLLHRNENKLNRYNVILTATMEVTTVLAELKQYFTGYSYYCRLLVERKRDILILAEYILKWYFRRHGVEDICLTVDAKAWLTEHTWPGNSTELIQRIMNAAKAIDDDFTKNVVVIDKDIFVETYDSYSVTPYSYAANIVQDELLEPA